MSVTIDHSTLKGAIDKLTTLASSIDSQRSAVTGGTPIALPSLSDGTLGQTSAWLRDQEPMLQGLHDIALLLTEEGATVASFFVGTDTTDIKKMLGETLADKAAMGNPNFPEDQKKYLEIFQRWQYDPGTMATFQSTLGPEGTLRTLSMWADAPADRATGDAPDDTQTALVEAMKRSLVTANEPGGFTDTESVDFAHGLVSAATIDSEDYIGRGPYNPSGALNYLLYDSTFNDKFIGTVAADLDQYERQDNDGASGLWSNRPEQGVEFGDFMDYGHHDPYSGNMDPMTGLMTAMSHNPSVALDFFADDDAGEGQDPRSEYYIKERNWDRDDYNGISQVLNAATTDESIVTGSPDEQQKAAMLASQTVHYFSERENKDDLPEILNRFPEDGASEDLAHILSTYMPSVQTGMDQQLNKGDGPDAGSFPIDSLGGRDTAPMPVFYEDGLKNFMLMSTATDQGLGELNAGINDWRGENLGALADTYQAAHDHADGTTDNSDVLSVTDAKEALENGIKSDARLQGFLLGTMGEDEIHDAAEQDARTKATIGMFSDIADAVPIPGAGKLAEGATKELITAGINHARGEGFDQLEDALTHAEADAVTDWDDKAGATLDRENYTVAALLDNRGLSSDPAGMDPTARPGGQILSYDEYVTLDPSDRRMVDEELFGTAHGVGTVMDRQDYAEAYKSEFGTYFEKGKG